MEYAANARIYVSATEIAVSTANEAIMCGSLALLNTLVDSEEGNFLDEPAFVTTVTNVATEISRSQLITSASESLLFEVLFGVAAKLRLEPAHLRFWFKPGAQNADEEPGYHQTRPSRSDDVVRDFPLFYLLLDHVHRGGKVGEFARTGLLYIIESTARSDRLERWIVESDLALLMASGLGGLYSQLSRYVEEMYSFEATPLNCLENWSCHTLRRMRLNFSSSPTTINPRSLLIH